MPLKQPNMIINPSTQRVVKEGTRVYKKLLRDGLLEQKQKQKHKPDEEYEEVEEYEEEVEEVEEVEEEEYTDSASEEYEYKKPIKRVIKKTLINKPVKKVIKKPVKKVIKKPLRDAQGLFLKQNKFKQPVKKHLIPVESEEDIEAELELLLNNM